MIGNFAGAQAEGVCKPTLEVLRHENTLQALKQLQSHLGRRCDESSVHTPVPNTIRNIQLKLTETVNNRLGHKVFFFNPKAFRKTWNYLNENRFGFCSQNKYINQTTKERPQIKIYVIIWGARESTESF